MSTGNTLEELHRFFEDDPNDYQLETQAEARLKALYSCLVNATSRTMLQIGLTGLLAYVKASQRSVVIDELLLSKDYISEIIAMAADHFPTASLLSATCLYECMLTYPKKFSPFLINKFRPLLPRIIYKKMSGPTEICCKCIAHLSVLGIPSSSKQSKSWKTEYDHYLKIASLLIDQLYAGVNDALSPEINDIETALTAEIGDLVSSMDYAAIFCNCCSVLRYLFYVQLDATIAAPCERTFKLIVKVISISSQQFNMLHRKQHLSVLLTPCIKLLDSLVTFNPSSFMFHIRSIFTCIISLLDLVRPQVEYLTLSSEIYQLLTSLFALFHRQVRIDVDVLQKLVRWLINDSTIRLRSKVPVAYVSRADHKLCRAALTCVQQLLNIYSDHMPKDQYSLIQNHFIQTLMACQATNSVINKPYDDELCRLGLYNILESLLINERADCSTIVAISKDLIDQATLADSSIKVKMEVRKLKLIWQQVNDSTNHLYQPWSFFTVEQPRKTVPNHVNSSMSTNELHHIFVPTSMPMMGNMSSAASSISMMHTEQPVLMHPPPLTKPSVYQPPLDTTAHVFVPPPMPYATHEHPAKMQPSNLETFVQPMTVEEHKHEYSRVSEQQPKRTKLMDTRPVEINEIDDDDDGAEQIFADGNHEVDDVERMDDEDEEDEEIDDDDEEMDESDEVDDDDDDRIDENEESDISSEDEDQLAIHTNGIKKSSQHLGIRESNVDLLGIDGPPTDASYLQTMNDNLHKKFRRQSQHHGILHAASDGFSHGIPHSTDPMQMNGDHENRAFVSNGQALSSAGANHDNQDDDDDIVLVSDDESEDKKSEKRLNHLPVAESFPSIADVTSIHVDKVTIHSTATAAATTTTTTSLVYDAVYATGHLDNIDRSSCGGHVIRIETPSVNDSATSLTLAIQETLESLRDAVTLVSDDYTISNDDNGQH